MDAPKASLCLPYLRSCKKECEKPIKGKLTGEIPKWLKGCLLRIGSGLLEIGPDKYNHVFDGMALIHRFNFQDGEVTYQNRFLRSDAYRRNMKANRIVVSEYGTKGVPDPCKTIFQRFASFFSMEITDNDLITIVRYGNETFACSETNNIWKIDTDTLESIYKVDLQKYVPVGTAIAHVHEDTDGTVYNIGTSYDGLYPHYKIIKFPPKDDKKLSPFDTGSVVCSIRASRILNPSYFHSFAMTENYFVLVEQPLFFSIPRIAWTHYIEGPLTDALHVDSNSPARFFVVRRSDGWLLDTSYMSPTFFAFHHINAYEDDDHIVVDLCAYDNGEMLQSFYVKALEELYNNTKDFQKCFASSARRYVLPLNVNKDQKDNETNLVTLKGCKAKATMDANGNIFCTHEVLTGAEPCFLDLPRINYEKYNGRKYKFFYALSRKNIEDTCVVKVNTETNETVFWGEVGVVPSEPVFQADPDSVNQDEDSGVILASLLYQDDESKVSMLVLNAKTMEEMGRATFKTNTVIPGDFHGTFVHKT